MIRGECRIKPGDMAHWYPAGATHTRCSLGPAHWQTIPGARSPKCSHCVEHLRREAKARRAQKDTKPWT